MSLESKQPADNSGNKQHQHFEGQLEELTYNSPIDTDKITVTQLEAVLGTNDRIIVPEKQSPNPYLGTITVSTPDGHGWRAPTLAKVDLSPQAEVRNSLRLIPLANAPENLKLSLAHGAQTTIDNLGWMVFCEEVGEKPTITGSTVVLNNQPNTVIGKGGNVAWEQYGFPDPEQINYNPLQGNPDVSEGHLRLTVTPEGIAITSLAENAKTVVHTRATNEHIRLLGA